MDSQDKKSQDVIVLHQRRKKPMRHVHAEFIAQLGKRKDIAAFLMEQTGEPILPQNISNWSVRGIPHRWRPYVVQLANERGVGIPRGFFKQKTISAWRQPDDDDETDTDSDE